jgi:dihydroorotate dehydrogenase
VKLRGIEFGTVFNSAGARGFAGEGYYWHRWMPGLDYVGSTFVAKTATLLPRAGNMALAGRDPVASPHPREYKPRSIWPDCIMVKPLEGVVLNAVGLSNPGIYRLALLWRSHRPKPPWMISIAPVGRTPEDRLDEIRSIVDCLAGTDLPEPWALQLNLSCPNTGAATGGAYIDLAGARSTGHSPDVFLTEAYEMINALDDLEVPVLLKVNALLDPVIAARLPGEGLVVSNTIPWGADHMFCDGVRHSTNIDWEGIFGSDVSPLARYGGGGLSGAPLLPLVVRWVQRARQAGYRRRIIGGGGILGPDDAQAVMRAGADAVELGSISILRPWRVRKTIKKANLTLAWGDTNT